MIHRMCNPFVFIVLLLLTITFAAGCGPGESADQVTPDDIGELAEEATPASSQKLPERATATRNEEPPPQPMSHGSNDSADESASVSDENTQPTRQPESRKSDSKAIEFMVRLLAKGEVGEFWFLALESIRSDHDLAPLSQNLTETWNGWNQEISDEIGITLQDAALAVSLPGDAAFLIGIKDLEGLQENLDDLGYQRQQNVAAVYWFNEDQHWTSITFLPNDVVMIMDRDPSDFLRGGVNDLIKHDSWDDDDWKDYLDALNTGNPNPGWEVGSEDELVSDISNGLLFHFNYRNDVISVWTKLDDGKIRRARIASFPDEETAKLEETMAEERLSRLREMSESLPEAVPGEESTEDQLMRAYFSDCTEVDPEFWTGGEVRVPLLN